VRARKTDFDRRGIAIVIISFAEPSRLLPYQNDHKWPFALLADPQRQAYRVFSLTRLAWSRVFSAAALKLYVKLLWQGMKKQDYGKDDIYQAGGDFLVDRHGSVLYAHRSTDPSDRPTVATLLQKIDAMILVGNDRPIDSTVKAP